MKSPKSAGKRVQWAVRFVGLEDIQSSRYNDMETACKVKQLWEKHNPDSRYELVKITTEPVETNKRKTK